MKKLKFLTLILSLFFTVSAWALVSYSTGTLTDSGIAVQGKGALTGVLIITDGTNAATVTVYDGSASGKVLAGPFVVVGSSRFGGGTWEVPVRYDTGLYVAISGTGAKAILYYTHEI